MKKTIEYQGKKYFLLELCIKHKEIYPEGQWVRVAPESFGEILEENSKGWDMKVDAEAVEIDEMIYHYIPDDIFEKADLKEIAEEHLDEKFELVEDENL